MRGWDGPTGVGTPIGLGGFATGGLALHNPGNVKAGANLALSWSTKLAFGSTGSAPVSYALTSGSLPPGTGLRADGVVRGTPTGVGSGTAIITATAGTATGATVLNWSVLHRFVHTGTAKIPEGKAKVGATVHAQVGTIRRDAKTGTVVKPNAKVQWLKNGRPIKGATTSRLRLTSKLKGHRISFSYSVSAKGYLDFAGVGKAIAIH